jgi:hypothetical protein
MADATNPSAVTEEVTWETVVEKLEAFGPLVRLRTAKGWELHSWNLFETSEGGIFRYPQMMVCTLWRKKWLNRR